MNYSQDYYEDFRITLDQRNEAREWARYFYKDLCKCVAVMMLDNEAIERAEKAERRADELERQLDALKRNHEWLREHHNRDDHHGNKEVDNAS